MNDRVEPGKRRRLSAFRGALICAAALVCCVGVAAGGVMFYSPKKPDTESVRFASSLGRGWNLGNTLEAWQIPKPEDTETCWGNPKTTKELIALVKELGFTSVRIPVTWFQHVDEDFNVDPAWLDRVNEVVDYVLSQDMFAIVNVQHDDQDWLITNYENEARAGEILSKLWAQIADRFADHDEQLVFDLMNEPRVVGSPDEWTGTAEEREVVNRLNRKALGVIRGAAGYNKTRYVMITTCCASLSEDNCGALEIPDDEHVIVSLHYYPGTAHRSEFPDCEKRFGVRDYLEINKTLRRIYDTFIKKGVGVSISEFGWTDRAHLGHLTQKAKWFVQCASKYGMSCLVWDNGGDFRLIDRNDLAAEFPDYVKAITAK
ncbi:MAG: glycoside hydrolase family 5 protein [Clostridia bacterium]|nr:glycoside hydrolase family 5 protein [Clostridia bacterium]